MPAAAIRCGAQVIVTANLRDFLDAVLAAYGVRALHLDFRFPRPRCDADGFG